MFTNKHNVKIVFKIMLFIFIYQNNMTKVFLTGVYFLYKIKGVHEEVISILNVNENKNKYKGRFSTTSSFLFGYKNKRFLNNEVVSSSI